MERNWGKGHTAPHHLDSDLLNVQLKEESDSDSDSSSDSDSESDDEEQQPQKKAENKPKDKKNVQWQVTPDLGELDDHSTLYREFDMDYPEKAKFSGWTHPLGWTDDGHDDDLVLLQMTADGIKERRISDKMMLQYEESEGPTKCDYGDQDQNNINREADNDYLIGKAKFHGWTNPLGWADTGADDETVI